MPVAMGRITPAAASLSESRMSLTTKPNAVSVNMASPTRKPLTEGPVCVQNTAPDKVPATSDDIGRVDPIGPHNFADIVLIDLGDAGRMIIPGDCRGWARIIPKCFSPGALHKVTALKNRHLLRNAKESLVRLQVLRGRSG